MRIKTLKLTEDAFQRQVIELAHFLGWRVAHFRKAMNRRGKWSTAVQGDGIGFPDLILLRHHRMVVAELKVGKNRTTPEQDTWLAAFASVTDDVFVWYPEGWETIRRTLA